MRGKGESSWPFEQSSQSGGLEPSNLSASGHPPQHHSGRFRERGRDRCQRDSTPRASTRFKRRGNRGKPSRGRTALYEAIHLSAILVARNLQSRRVLILPTPSVADHVGFIWTALRPVLGNTKREDSFGLRFCQLLVPVVSLAVCKLLKMCESGV